MYIYTQAHLKNGEFMQNQYVKKTIPITAIQWFRNGDHPLDHSIYLKENDTGDEYLSEGEIVRYYRHPDVDGGTICRQCDKSMHFHGWLDTLEDGYKVCPGDFILTGRVGNHYPCKPDIFTASYELYKEPTS